MVAKNTTNPVQIDMRSIFAIVMGIDYRKFRITWQKKNKNSDERRFHIVPYRKDEEIDTSAKFSIPVLYLGLSRLFPIGEADENRLNSTMVKFKTEEHQK